MAWYLVKNRDNLMELTVFQLNERGGQNASTFRVFVLENGEEVSYHALVGYRQSMPLQNS